MSNTRFKEGYPAYLCRNCGLAYGDHEEGELCPEFELSALEMGNPYELGHDGDPFNE